jgi:hypothetical protein
VNTVRGAYGLRITGLEDADDHLPEVPASWPELHLEQASPVADREPEAPGTIRIERDRAELWLAEAGRILVRREPLTVSFATATPLSADAVLHPFLGLPAAIINRWLGRISLHGGAFAYRDHAWALLGNREAGKSATLGSLLKAGHHILSDDILVLAGTELFAGPRSIDLREDAGASVGGEALGVIGNRARWRLRPGAGPAAMPLGGLISLEWARDQAIEPIDTEARLRRLIGSSALRPDAASAPGLLELAALPAWRFARRRRLADIGGSIELLLATLDAA